MYNSIMKKNHNEYGWIYEIKSTGLSVKSGKWKGFISYKDITDFPNFELQNMFNINEKVHFKVLEVDEIKHRFVGSFKLLHLMYSKQKFKFELKETPSGFKNLLKSIIEEYHE